VSIRIQLYGGQQSPCHHPWPGADITGGATSDVHSWICTTFSVARRARDPSERAGPTEALAAVAMLGKKDILAVRAYCAEKFDILFSPRTGHIFVSIARTIYISALNQCVRRGQIFRIHGWGGSGFLSE